MKKEKNTKRTLSIIITIFIAIAVFLWYPWFVSMNEYGETICSNILGFVMNC